MIKKSIILGASMVMLSEGILVSAAQGTTVSGASKTTSYHGWVEGSRNAYGSVGTSTGSSRTFARLY
ncbi:hypothetical protein [Clostridium sp.]|uniref:hypothetical protein n=1 Tax=Clostridium sp. TaxID=1506 RepID=UPI002607624D